MERPSAARHSRGTGSMRLPFIPREEKFFDFVYAALLRGILG